jgi:hypothetical protein
MTTDQRRIAELEQEIERLRDWVHMRGLLLPGEREAYLPTDDEIEWHAPEWI